LSAELPYRRGEILASTEDDLAKLSVAWREIERRHRAGEPVYNFTGLERSLRVDPDALELMDDELAPALYGERLTRAALDHLGGVSGRDDVLLANRLTAAIVVAMQVLVRAGSTVVGVSPSYSHPAVIRAVRLAGGRFVETRGADALSRQLAENDGVSLVVLTRLAVTYEVLEGKETRSCRRDCASVRGPRLRRRRGRRARWAGRVRPAEDARAGRRGRRDRPRQVRHDGAAARVAGGADGAG